MAKHFRRKGKKVLGLDLQQVIRGFFSGNALLSIVILFLICFFLALEGVRFFPGSKREMTRFRASGQEYVTHLVKEVQEHTHLTSALNRAYQQELIFRFKNEKGIEDSYKALAGELEDAGEDAMDDWEDAEDDEDEEALAEAKEEWAEESAKVLASVKRAEIDSFGRVDDASWKALLESMKQWDPVEGDPPAFVQAAIDKQEAGMAPYKAAVDAAVASRERLEKLRNELTSIARKTKDDSVANSTAADRKAAYLEAAKNAKSEEERAEKLAKADEVVIIDDFPYEERTEPIRAAKPEHAAAVAETEMKLGEAMKLIPDEWESEESADLVAEVRKRYPKYLKALDKSEEEAAAWQFDEKPSNLEVLKSFFFGQEWVTNSSWHEFYGLLPLFSGSLLISLVAVCVAVPFAIAGAIYVNRLASPIEKAAIKPVIEMIQAIPSVVLGFIGIAILGTFLRDVSQVSWLSWVPGFPMQERLNVLNAGLLLALMAIPTIFTLCEDALNNVPQSFSEASLALGASKLQTVFKVVVPCAVSGIMAAVLLGFGRIIGETMVVLLVAGNKVAMPDFGAGLGVITQPTHTMTGIIAQEMGEVGAGTLHYRALFLVALVLFTISLVINIIAQRIISRYKHG